MLTSKHSTDKVQTGAVRRLCLCFVVYVLGDVMFDIPKTQNELNTIVDISWTFYEQARLYTIIGIESSARKCMQQFSAIQQFIENLC